MFVIVLLLCGDRDFYANDLHLPHWNNPWPCEMCDASRLTPDNNVMDLTPTAKFKRTLKPPGTTLPSTHSLATLLNVTLYMLVHDWMHNGDLGILQHAIACILFTIVFLTDATTTAGAQRNLVQVWGAIREQYQVLHVDCRLGTLTLSMFCDPRSPHGAYPQMTAPGALCPGKNNRC